MPLSTPSAPMNPTSACSILRRLGAVAVLGLLVVAPAAAQDAASGPAPPDTLDRPVLIPADGPEAAALRQEAPDRTPLPDRWRRLDPRGLPVVGYPVLNPYQQNPLKGDLAVLGQNTFVVLTLLGAPATTFSNQEGAETQLNTRFIGALELFNGLTVFKPKNWSVKGSFQGVVNQGGANDLSEVELLELFGEFKLANLGDQYYDFASVRGGLQAFNADLRGFLYNDINLGGQFFGEAASNRYRWAVAVFLPREKGPGGGLTFTTNNQTVVSGTLVAEDFARPGFNAILTAAANLDDSVEDAGLNVVYLGFTSDGHVGRLFVLPTAYLAFGTDDFNPVAGQETSVSAFMAGIELAYPKNWLTYRAAAFVASGDSDPDDDSATGFDSILDNVGLFGGATSFVVGGASFFTRPNSFLPAGRVAASGLGTRANFVNPGIQLLNAGLDAVVSPRIFAQLDYNYFRFFEPAAAGLADDEAALGQEINAALRFRAFLNENLVFQVGGSAFLPGTAGEALLGASDTILTGNVALLALF